MEFNHDSTTSFPKRIRSVSAKLFNITNKDESSPVTHQHTTSNKRISCQIISSADQKILNPSTWFPRIRCRSTSSASSTFSMVFSNSTTTNTSCEDEYYQQPSTPVLLESLSSELEDLYKTAQEELDYAVESQGSIYYEGDRCTAQQAVDLCTIKYQEAMHLFNNTTNAIKFKFRWESDLYQLSCKLNTLPHVTHSIYD